MFEKKFEKLYKVLEKLNFKLSYDNENISNYSNYKNSKLIHYFLNYLPTNKVMIFTFNIIDCNIFSTNKYYEITTETEVIYLLKKEFKHELRKETIKLLLK